MNFNVFKTSIDLNDIFQKNEGESDSQLEYARVLGSLIYIINYKRPYIACVIRKLSWFTNNLNQTHWMVLKRVLGYLKHKQHYDLHYNKHHVVIEGYSDTKWITRSNEVKSTSGMCLHLVEDQTLKSSKQTCIGAPKWNMNLLF